MNIMETDHQTLTVFFWSFMESMESTDSTESMDSMDPVIEPMDSRDSMDPIDSPAAMGSFDFTVSMESMGSRRCPWIPRLA